MPGQGGPKILETHQAVIQKSIPFITNIHKIRINCELYFEHLLHEICSLVKQQLSRPKMPKIRANPCKGFHFCDALSCSI